MTTRILAELIDGEDSAWPEIAEAVAAAPCPVEVLAADPVRADDELIAAQVTTRSWLGALVHGSGGLLIDHGWLRVFGSGRPDRRLASLSEANDGVSGGVLVAQDVLGGQFAWTAAGVQYHAPDSLEWENLEVGYGHWLAAMLGGGLTGFAENLRWDGWEAEAAACPLDHGIHLWPPPWTAEGKDPAAVSRKAVPMRELGL